MRSPVFNVTEEAARKLDREVVLDIFRRMCLGRYFDLGVCEAFKKGFIKKNVYLSLGQEAIAAAISKAVPGYMIFAQHRCHATYLSFGGDPVKLRDELLGLRSGTSGGRAGSNCIQCHENGVTMFGHHGLIGENVPLGVGAALGSGKDTVCFFGDGAAEEDYVFAAMGFAATHKLPVLFVCEDNDLSILTTTDVRRSWSITGVADKLGIKAIDIADDPWTVYNRAKEWTSMLPAFINVYTCRARWHVGVGIDGPPEWDRFEIVKKQLENLGLSLEAGQVEDEVGESMERIWNEERLQILLGK